MDDIPALDHKDINFKNVAIIGSGVMGTALNAFLISQDINVTLFSARKFIDQSQNFKVDLNLYDLIIECSREEMQIKKFIMNYISQANSDGIIGTCTSSISVSKLQESIENPGRFCGIHFMNPPRAINVVELIEGKLTDKGTLEIVEEFLLQLGREVFKIADSPGFAVNSILMSMLNQAVYTLDSCGLEPEDLDRIMKKTIGLKLGPLATIDLIGVDVTLKILQNLYSENRNEFLPPAKRLIQMFEQGFLGRKTNKGFFEYQ